MPKVSVIMPAYNAERYVGEGISSMLAQTLTDWQLIIIDDGSTDGTLTVLQGITDSRIVVLHQENQGTGAARNTGLKMATGQYIGFLDADDIYLKNGLADLAHFLDNFSQYDVVYSDGIMCNQSGEPIMYLADVRPDVYVGWILEHLLVNGNVVTVPACTLTRRDALLRHCVSFDAQGRVAEDYFFWIQMARFGQFGYLDKLTCMYRIHEKNKTSTIDRSRRSASLAHSWLKIINTEWFLDTPIKARWRLYYHVLTDLLANDSRQQEDILQTAPFQTLPTNLQADLLRSVAVGHLIRRRNSDFALQCLQESLALQPGSLKARLLLGLASRSPALAAAVLSVWQAAHAVQNRVRSFGQRRPKPVPAALLPADSSTTR